MDAVWLQCNGESVSSPSERASERAPTNQRNQQVETILHLYDARQLSCAPLDQPYANMTQ